MAEIFSIVATCVGLASEIGKAIKTIDTLVKCFKSVPDDIENLESCLWTTQATVQILQAALDTPGKVDDAVKQHFDCSLKNCMNTVTRLHQNLEPMAKDVSQKDGDAGTRPVMVDAWSRMKFLWDESNISEDKTELYEHMQAVDVLRHVVQL